MARYLTSEQLRANLSLGKTVEQWLSAEKVDDYVVLKWLWVKREAIEEYSVNFVECFDDGDDEFYDIVEFSDLDPDRPSITNTFSSINDALKFVVDTYCASLDNFVMQGMIEEEYRDYRKSI